MPECPAPGPGHGHGRLWEPQSAPAVPIHAQEDRGRDELWLPPGSPHGFGAPLPGRRKVIGLFQRQISALISVSSIPLVFNTTWMHKGVSCWKRKSCCLRALLEIPFLIPPKYFGLLCYLEGKLKDNVVFFLQIFPEHFQLVHCCSPLCSVPSLPCSQHGQSVRLSWGSHFLQLNHLLTKD